MATSIFMLRTRFLALLGLLALVLAPAAAQATTVADVAAALRQDPVYNQAGASRALSADDLAELRRRIHDADTPIFVAVLPEAAIASNGGNADDLLQAIARKTGLSGAYALVTDHEFRTGSLREGNGAGEAGTLAFQAHKADGTRAVLDDFVDRVDDLQAASTGAGRGSAGGLFGLGWFWTLFLAAAAFFGIRRVVVGTRRSRQAAAELAEVSDVAPGGPVPPAERHRRARHELPAGPRRGDRRHLPGRGQGARAGPAPARQGRARCAISASSPGPSRRAATSWPAPGPGSRDTELPRAHGAVLLQPPARPVDGLGLVDAARRRRARDVPACDVCAHQLAEGREPAAREITVGDARVPHWQAPRYYAPWMGGYYGWPGSGFGLGEVFTGFIIGDALAGGFGHQRRRRPRSSAATAAGSAAAEATGAAAGARATPAAAGSAAVAATGAAAAAATSAAEAATRRRRRRGLRRR